MGNQLESALVIALRDTIKWESAVETSASGTLPPVTPDLPFDAKVYQDRDRWLAYRDLILGAAVVEVSVQVGDVWNYSTIKPSLQGPAPFTLPFVGTEAGTLSTQVRHVTNVSIPYDAARYADADLYGRDSIVYECLARACSATFIDPSIPLSDSTGTNVPNTSIWSLAEGTEVRADINEVLPLNRDLFKKPDQNLADRDNQLAGYTAQLVQVLKNPFEHATRLYVQVEAYGTIQREPDVYALTSDGTERVFQTEPAVPGSNRIIYNTNKKTLQWTRERVDEVHVPQLYAMVIPGIEFGQLVETLAEVPEKKDSQYWRGKAGQLNPDGVRLVDTDVYLTSTNNNAVSGGVMQYGSASFTVPDVMTFTMGGSLTGGNYRVSVLTKPNNVVEIAGAQNNSLTGGIAGGATFDINVPSGSILEKTYVVVGGNGIVYNGVTYLPGDTFNGLTGITTYTTNPPVASTVRQYALSFNLALPAGAWRCLLEYTNLSGTTDGFAIKAEYIAVGEDPIIVIQDTAPIPWTANNGDVVFSPPSAFDVPTSVPFTFNIYWTGGEGQLHIRKIIFDNLDVSTGRYAMTGTFVGSIAQVDVNGSSAVPDVMRWHYTSFGTTHTGGIPFTINYTQDPALPIQIQQVQVQVYEDYAVTPLSQRFQGWRQECLDRAERVIQQGYNAAIAAYGTSVPTFRDSGSVWTQESTENWMSFVEVYNPRVREVDAIVDTGITAGRQYQVETVLVNYGGTVYTEGQKFYGVASSGTVYTGGTVHQVGAFKKSQPGHLGKPALVPYGLYWDEFTQRCMSWYDTALSVPTIQACQAWMIEQGLYVAQDDFWMPETLGLTIPTPPIPPVAPAQIQVTPDPLVFNSPVPIGTSRTKFWNVANLGGASLTGTVAISSSKFVAIAGSPYVVPGGLSNNVSIEYTPVLPAGGTGVTSVVDFGTGVFTGGGGDVAVAIGFGTVPYCPVVLTPNVDWSWSTISGPSFALAWHRPTRRLLSFANNRGSFVVSSSETDSFLGQIDFDGVPNLYNNGLVIDTKNDKILSVDQRGHYMFHDPYTYAQIGPKGISGVLPQTPPYWFSIAYDYDTGKAVWTYPQGFAAPNPLFVLDCNTQTGVVVPHAPWWNNSYRCYNDRLKKVVIPNGDPGVTTPWWYFDTTTFAFTASTFGGGLLGLFDSLFFEPVTGVMICRRLATNQIYVVDGTTEALLGIGPAWTNNINGVVCDVCQNNRVIVTATGFAGRIWEFDSSTWLYTQISTDQVGNLIHDPWSNAFYGMLNRPSETIRKYTTL